MAIEKSGKNSLWFTEQIYNQFIASFNWNQGSAFGNYGAFLFEQEGFRFKQLLYFLMLAPLVIPGVILGNSILLLSDTLGTYFETTWGLDIELFRPGF